MDFRHDIQQCLPNKLKTMLLSEELLKCTDPSPLVSYHIISFAFLM